MKSIKIILTSALVISIFIWLLVEYIKSTDKYLYGHSYRQNQIVNTIRLHKYGITGRNITIGIIDAGFYRKHEVFANTRIIKEFDFVTNKPTTLNYKHVKGLDHGTNVFSVVGGYEVNELVGIAFGANFILAKTDISTDRLKEEEANAVKASKWLVKNGANIITTSLSFNKFDNANYYFSNEMNGRTALITRAADSIAQNGTVYICSAGNNYEEDWHIIEPPGDGFNVLAAGSIDKNLIHSFFSSCGPTIDGRIKPDIVAPGEGVWVANYLPKLKPEFGWSHGTSLSAPITAGIAALILSAHPELSSDQVVEAIKNSSSHAGHPDNLYGWGVPDAEKAVTYFGPAFSNIPELIDPGNNIKMQTYVFSSYGLINSSVKLNILNDKQEQESYYIMKNEEENHYSVVVNVNISKGKIKFYFSAKDKRGIETKFPSGILGEYFICKKKRGKLEIMNSGKDIASN